MKRGDSNLYNFLRDNATPLDCSNALKQYLLKRKPLLPERIQSLMCAENDGVTTTTIALDALGLLFEELRNSNNFIIICKLLDMMRALTISGSQRPSETRVCHAPFILVPIFFLETVRNSIFFFPVDGSPCELFFLFSATSYLIIKEFVMSYMR